MVIRLSELVFALKYLKDKLITKATVENDSYEVDLQPIKRELVAISGLPLKLQKKIVAMTISFLENAERLLEVGVPTKEIFNGLSLLDDLALHEISNIAKQEMLPSGGAWEEEVCCILRRKAAKYRGLKQLTLVMAIDSLEKPVIQLACESNLHPIDAIVKMRTRHEKGKKNCGIHKGEIVDNVPDYVSIIQAETEIKLSVKIANDILSHIKNEGSLQK